MARQGLFSPFLISPSLHPSLLSTLKAPSTNSTTKSNATPTTTTIAHDQEINRRSANYPPSSWDYNIVKSLTSDYTEEKYGSQVDELKEYVKNLINSDTDVPLAKLELIDSVQRLGLKYHFEKEIKKALDAIYSDSNANDDAAWLNSDLYATALRFRLFRQHGYDVPQVPDVFKRFKDETGNINPCLRKDVKGLLSLYEASFFGLQGEDILDEAKTFTITHLKSVKEEISPTMQRKVKHALDKPLHWTLPRVEAKWFIDTYEQDEQNMDPNMLQLAKLDYNIVQSIYQKEVGKLARWWMDLGLHDMSFARDRLVEHYSWCNGIVWEPQYGTFREITTKVISLITIIDDFYDVYGSIEELELFTDFVERWDIREIDKLPYNIRIVFLAMFNISNEIGYWTLKERGFNIIPYLSKQWAYQCNSYFREAKMFHEEYKPTLDEYFDNAVASIGGLILLFCSYFLTTDKITVEALNYIDQFPSIMKSSCMIARLINDLGTSSDESARGDAPKAIQCYMKDTGATEEVAREYINNLIHESWKILNRDIMHKRYPFFSEPFLSSNLDGARTAYFFYQYGDGHGTQNCWTKDHLISLLVQPFTLS